jgi:hypothetical protein
MQTEKLAVSMGLARPNIEPLARHLKSVFFTKASLSHI